MSFFEGDTRTGEQPAPPPRDLTPIEIGAIAGTLAVFVGVVGSLLFYRAHRGKKRRDKNGERVDDDEELQPQGAGDAKGGGGGASFRPQEVRVASLPPPPPKPLPPRTKKTWDPYGGARIEDAKVEGAESHEMQEGVTVGLAIKREAY
ncbi:hypothetical protein LX36DRAFT_659227 [Colletotrichum falcatum]|nr:hypothetical protein LX36DRAFT_659227 [Colletotrichum falcatum]